MILAVIVSLILDNILGVIWYSPQLFGDTWVRLAHPGRRASEMNLPPSAYMMAMFGHTIVAYTIYFITRVLLRISEVDQAIQVALYLCALVCGSQICHSAFARRPVTWYLIDHGYDAVCILTTTLTMVLLA